MVAVSAPKTPYILIRPKLYNTRFAIAGDLRLTTANAKGLHIPAQCKLPAIPIIKAAKNILNIDYRFYEIFFLIHRPLHPGAIHTFSDIINRN